MVDLAEHGGEGFIPLKAITERQNISQKYLEGIMASLSKAGLVEGAHGKGGGYRLCREPDKYKVSERKVYNIIKKFETNCTAGAV